jgi:hypothetical protein
MICQGDDGLFYIIATQDCGLNNLPIWNIHLYLRTGSASIEMGKFYRKVIWSPFLSIPYVMHQCINASWR